MNLIPEGVQPISGRCHARGKTGQIPIQYLEPALHDQQPDVAGAREQRFYSFELTSDIDRGAVERRAVQAIEKRRRQNAFYLGEEIEVISVARKVEIGSAWIRALDRSAKGGTVGSGAPIREVEEAAATPADIPPTAESRTALGEARAASGAAAASGAGKASPPGSSPAVKLASNAAMTMRLP